MKLFITFFLSSLAVLFVGFVAAPPVAAYGEPTFAGSSTNPPTCSNTAPKSVWPFTAKAVGTNAIELKWGKMDNVSTWTVAYGLAPKKYIYGLSNFGNGEWRTLTINELPAGTYYVAIRGNNGCMPGAFSLEWKVTVGGGSARLASAGVGGSRLGAYVQQNTVVNPTYTNPAQNNKVVVPSVQPSKPNTVVPSTQPKKVSWWQSILNAFKGKK